jgi:hypothetical protein
MKTLIFVISMSVALSLGLGYPSPAAADPTEPTPVVPKQIVDKVSRQLRQHIESQWLKNHVQGLDKPQYSCLASASQQDCIPIPNTSKALRDQSTQSAL